MTNNEKLNMIINVMNIREDEILHRDYYSITIRSRDEDEDDLAITFKVNNDGSFTTYIHDENDKPKFHVGFGV